MERNLLAERDALCNKAGCDFCSLTDMDDCYKAFINMSVEEQEAFIKEQEEFLEMRKKWWENRNNG